jgi:hypothetical protein
MGFAGRVVGLVSEKPGAAAIRGAAAGGASDQAFLLGPLARQLARPAHGFGLLPGPSLGRLLVVFPHLHLAEYALALQLLLQGAQRLIDVVVANVDLYQGPSPLPDGLASNQKKENQPLRRTQATDPGDGLFSAKPPSCEALN